MNKGTLLTGLFKVDSKKNNYKANSRAVVASMGTHSTKDTALKTKTENHPPKT